MPDFPSLPRCPFERQPRWESGRRKCNVVGTMDACGFGNPEKCPFVRIAREKAKG